MPIRASRFVTNLAEDHEEPSCSVAIYVWGRHFKTYLSQMDHQCVMSPRELMEALGRQRRRKFQRRRQEWIEGRGKIPLQFLEFIRVDIEVLEDAVALDRKEFEAAMASCPIPTSVNFRIEAGLWIPLDVPDDVQDSFALQLFMESLAIENRSDVSANYSGLKTVYVTAAGKVAVAELPPGFDIRPPYLRFWQDGSRIGNMYPNWTLISV